MNKQNLKMIPCPKCSEPFPELRKINYGYNHCVNCSTVERKVAITTVEGTGDHTYNDLIIMEADQYRSIAAKAADTNAAAKSLPSSPISNIPARSENNPARQTNNNGVARRSELSKTCNRVRKSIIR